MERLRLRADAFGLPIGGVFDRGARLRGDLKPYRTAGQGWAIRPTHFTGVRDTDARQSRYSQDDVTRPFPGDPVSLGLTGAA